MFLDFFFALRAHKVPVSTTEYLDLIQVVEVLTQKNEPITPERFYHLARHCLVKDLKYYDSYDICFSKYFGELINETGDFKNALDEWLKGAKKQELSKERKNQAMNLPSEKLMEELEKRLKEQKKRHDGGNHWIGTGGTSAFGHSGYNPQGLRIGGSGRSKSALAVAGERRFKDYRTDQTLNLRQIKMALKGLRSLEKRGRPEISLKKSIHETCQNAGEIQIVEESSRKNTMKVVLLMDVGGSMTAHSQRVNELFSALHQVNHFKEFSAFYFHNIFYDHLYTRADLSWDNAIEIEKLYRRFGPQTRIIIVGDASMAPYELFQMNGEMRNYYDYFGRVRYKREGESPIALSRLQELLEHYPKTIWLNPEEKNLWHGTTIKAIAKQVAMFRLSLEGLKKSVSYLKS